jgi:starvation-inducible DNA-binding protein
VAVLRSAISATPSDLGERAAKDIGGAMNAILANVFALYLKTKNFHWHVTGPHFRDYHLLLDEQADQIFAMTDPIAERVRKVRTNDHLDRSDCRHEARSRQRRGLCGGVGHAR